MRMRDCIGRQSRIAISNPMRTNVRDLTDADIFLASSLAQSLLEGTETNLDVHLEYVTIFSNMQSVANTVQQNKAQGFDMSGRTVNHSLGLKSRPFHAPRKIRDRTKHRKLVGADMYVARFVDAPREPSRVAYSPTLDNPDADNVLESSVHCIGTPPTGSLHDELASNSAKPGDLPKPSTSDSPLDRYRVGVSRPCYRCISYMHTAGIRRVFWTNNEGKWDGAKVRDLIAMLEGSSPTGLEVARGCAGTGFTDAGIFVTKHEVLILKQRFLQGG
jgi:hypothetical protein